MEWICLAITLFVWMAGCCLSFADKAKAFWWYIPLGVFLGACSNFLWFFAMRHIDGDKHRSYILTLFWETCLVIVYFGMPLIFFDVKIDRWTTLALVLMATGMLVLKLRP